jgi:hypothetical protein
MYISQETSEQTHKRLCSVIRNSDFKRYEGTFAFEEFPLNEFHSKVNQQSLALVRDSEIWSQLVESKDQTKELFIIFSFHFKEGGDNSGFVGWLASHLKQKLGTGVFVTCGQNSKRGGIFDYWGCPAELGASAIDEVEKLINNK